VHIAAKPLSMSAIHCALHHNRTASPLRPPSLAHLGPDALVAVGSFAALEQQSHVRGERETRGPRFSLKFRFELWRDV